MSDPQARATTVLTRITSLRILVVPAVMALILKGDDTRFAYVAAAGLFVLAAGTDFVDGYLARRWALTTPLGSFLDTTADKLLVTGTLVALVAVERASPWLAAIMVGRELAVLGLRAIVAFDGVVMDPSIWGKLKANAQFVAIALAIVRFSWELGPLHVDEWAMLAAAGITVISAWDYFARWSSALSAGRS